MRQRLARSIIFIAFLACIVGGSAADALATLPTDKPQFTVRASESMRIAREFWNAESPCGAVNIYRATGDQMSAVTGKEHTAGMTDWCHIWTPIGDNGWMDRIQSCTIVVHEYGHVVRAYGYDHAAKHGSVMYPELELNEVVYGCYKRFLPKGKGREFRELVGKPLFLRR